MNIYYRNYGDHLNTNTNRETARKPSQSLQPRLSNWKIDIISGVAPLKERCGYMKALS